MKEISLKGVVICLLAIFLFYPHSAMPADKAKAPDKDKKPPVTQYLMSVSTQNQSIPGMPSSSEMPGGIEGFMMGKMMGGAGFGGASRSLMLQLNSPQQMPSEPEGMHDIPAGQNMGKALPLEIPVYEKAKAEKDEDVQEEKPPIEKPKMRMLIYWGCSETVGKGQPRVIDTEKMSIEEFGRAMAIGRTPSRQNIPRPKGGWIYADWPNKKSNVKIPKDSSLKGEHLVHGNYIMPEIKFSISSQHDFMAPVELTSNGGLTDSIRLQWKSIPTAIGYFATAMGGGQKGDMVIWSSSEVPETGFALMDYLLSSDVRKFIKDKAVMNSNTTSCNIPKGIFKDAGGGMVQFIAYGEDMYASYPPKPKDPKEPWNLIWSARVRLKSTGMVPLGMEQAEAGKRGKKPAMKEDEGESTEKTQKQPEGGTSPKKLLKGLFGF